MAISQPIGIDTASQASTFRPRTHNLSGQTHFGWKVIGVGRRVAMSGSPIQYWNVVCEECGEPREFQAHNLHRGKVARCNHVRSRVESDLLAPEYLPVEGYPGYRVGRDGTVWSCHIGGGKGGMSNRWTPHCPSYDKDGYRLVCLKRNGKGKTFRVSHVVLTAFCGPKPDGMEACHFPDSDLNNNRAENLRWATHQQNISDKVVHGTVAKGSRHGRSILTESQVLEIRELRRTTKLSCYKIAARYGITGGHVADIVKRVVWRHI